MKDEGSFGSRPRRFKRTKGRGLGTECANGIFPISSIGDVTIDYSRTDDWKGADVSWTYAQCPILVAYTGAL